MSLVLQLIRSSLLLNVAVSSLLLPIRPSPSSPTATFWPLPQWSPTTTFRPAETQLAWSRHTLRTPRSDQHIDEVQLATEDQVLIVGDGQNVTWFYLAASVEQGRVMTDAMKEALKASSMDGCNTSSEWAVVGIAHAKPSQTRLRDIFERVSAHLDYFMLDLQMRVAETDVREAVSRFSQAVLWHNVTASLEQQGHLNVQIHFRECSKDTPCPIQRDSRHESETVFIIACVLASLTLGALLAHIFATRARNDRQRAQSTDKR